MLALQRIPVLIEVAPLGTRQAKIAADHPAPVHKERLKLRGGYGRAIGQPVLGLPAPAGSALSHRPEHLLVFDPKDLAGVLVLPGMPAGLALALEVQDVGLSPATRFVEGALGARKPQDLTHGLNAEPTGPATPRKPATTDPPSGATIRVVRLTRPTPAGRSAGYDRRHKGWVWVGE